MSSVCLCGCCSCCNFSQRKKRPFKYRCVNVVNSSSSDVVCTTRCKAYKRKIFLPAHHRQLIQHCEEGHENFRFRIKKASSKRKENGFSREIKTPFEVVITDDSGFGRQDPESCVNRCSESRVTESSFLPITFEPWPRIETTDGGSVNAPQSEPFLELMKQNDFFKLLQVTRNATQDEIRKSYWRLKGYYRLPNVPDRNGNNLKIKIINQKLDEAYQFMKDEENRKMHEKFVDYNRGFFSLARWRSLLQDRIRLPCFLPVFMLIAAGVAVSVSSSGSDLPFVLACSAVGGGVLSAGFASLCYVMSEEAAVYGMKYRHFAKILGINALMGAVIGCACSWITMDALPNAIVAILPASIVSSDLACLAITGATCAAVDGACWGVGNVLAQAAVSDRWKYMTTVSKFGDVVKGLGVGMLIGGAFGAILGTIGAVFGRECIMMKSGGDETVANLAGAVQRSSRVALADAQAALQGMFRATRQVPLIGAFARGAVSLTKSVATSATNKALDKAVSFGTGPIHVDIPIEIQSSANCEVISANAVHFSDPVDEGNQGNQGNQENLTVILPNPEKPNANSESPATHLEPDETDQNYFTFYNDCSGVVGRMVVGCNDSKPRIVYDNQTVCLPQDSKNITVQFQVWRFGWRSIKRETANDNLCFSYQRPPMRSFTLNGSLSCETVCEIRNEIEEIVAS